MTLAELNKAAESANLTEARRHFQQLLADPKTSSKTVVWNTLLKAHANAGDLVGAERCFREMEQRGVRTNEKTYGKLVEAAAKAAEPDRAETWLQCLGSDSPVPYNTMIDACAKANDTQRAVKWLQQMKELQLRPAGIAYHALINAFAQAGDLRGALVWLREASELGAEGGEATFLALLMGCARSARPDLAKEWIQEMKAQGLTPSIKCYSAALGSARSAQQAAQWLREMRESHTELDTEGYTVLIHGCAERGELQEAEKWMQEALASKKSDLQCFATMVNAYARATAVEGADRWLSVMEKEHLRPNEVIYGSLISSSRDAQLAERLLQRMRDSKLVPNVVNYTAVLTAYGRRGDFHKATELLEEMRQAEVVPNIISWNALLDSFVKGDGNATRCLNEMVQTKMEPNVVSFTSMIDYHSRRADPEAAELWLLRMRSLHLRPSAVTFTAVLKGYAKTGQVDEAAKVLRRMALSQLPLDVVAWTGLLSACAAAKRWDVALCALRWMRQLQVSPNQITHQALKRMGLR